MVTAEILFIAAEPREFSGALRFWQDVRPLDLPVSWARSARRKNQPVIAIANGAGWERARLAGGAATYNKLCNIGFCGALDPALRIADIVVSSQHLPVQCKAHHATGAVASVREIARTAEAKRALWSQGFIAVEMESAGLQDRPMHCIKAVSDLASDSLANDFSAALLPDGRTSTWRVVTGAMRDPLRRVPELFRLARNASAASNRLGEFLNACEL